MTSNCFSTAGRLPAHARHHRRASSRCKPLYEALESIFTLYYYCTSSSARVLETAARTHGRRGRHGAPVQALSQIRHNGAPVFFIEFATTGDEGADALIRLSRAPPSPSPSVIPPLSSLFSLSLSSLPPSRTATRIQLSLTHKHFLSLSYTLNLSPPPSLPLPLSRPPNLHTYLSFPPRPPRLASLRPVGPAFRAIAYIAYVATAQGARPMPRSARARRAPAGAVVFSYPERRDAARDTASESRAEARYSTCTGSQRELSSVRIPSGATPRAASESRVMHMAVARYSRYTVPYYTKCNVKM